MPLLDLTWPKVLTAGFLLASACTAATYQMIVLAKQSELSALKEQVATANLQVATANLRTEIQDRRVAELERRLDAASISGKVPTQKPQSAAATASSGIPSIRVLSPSHGATVDAFVDIRIEVVGTVPRDHRAVLLVRDPTGQWWSWGPAQGDTWYGVQIGTGSDRGKQFELRVVLTGQTLEPGRPMRSAAQGIAVASVQVNRK